MTKFVFCLWFGVVSVWLPSVVHGDVVITFIEGGNNVNSSAEGTIDTSGLTSQGQFAAGGNVFNGDSLNTPAVTVGGFANYDAYFGSATGAGLLGAPPTQTFDTTGSPDIFLIKANQVGPGTGFLGVPAGYVSGSPINTSSVYNNHSLASLGMDPGSYVWMIGNNTITLNAVTVPEPSSFAAFCLLGATASCRRRRAAI